MSATIEQWDFDAHQFKRGVHGRAEKNAKLDEYREKANKIKEEHFIDKPFSLQKFTELMRAENRVEVKVAEFCQLVAQEFYKKGQIQSGDYYKYTGVSVLKVSPSDITFHEFDEMWLRQFEDYFTSRGVKCYNYMVHLRSIYNKAVQKRYVDFKNNPFKNPYTNPYGYTFSHLKKIKNRSNRIKDLTLDQLIALKNISYLTPLEKKYMAIWFFSFYNVGVNLIDIAQMKHKDIRNGRWYYARNKTGVALKTGKPLLQEALDIIENYGSKNSDYVFDILVGYDANEESITRRVHSYANK
ncbi:MAG: hypothetical protein DWQ02_20570, partial [Bacteroidetes bacterium]